jgi:hypothetical protein
VLARARRSPPTPPRAARHGDDPLLPHAGRDGQADDHSGSDSAPPIAETSAEASFPPAIRRVAAIAAELGSWHSGLDSAPPRSPADSAPLAVTGPIVAATGPAAGGAVHSCGAGLAFGERGVPEPFARLAGVSPRHRLVVTEDDRTVDGPLLAGPFVAVRTSLADDVESLGWAAAGEDGAASSVPIATMDHVLVALSLELHISSRRNAASVQVLAGGAVAFLQPDKTTRKDGESPVGCCPEDDDDDGAGSSFSSFSFSRQRDPAKEVTAFGSARDMRGFRRTPRFTQIATELIAARRAVYESKTLAVPQPGRPLRVMWDGYLASCTGWANEALSYIKILEPFVDVWTAADGGFCPGILANERHGLERMRLRPMPRPKHGPAAASDAGSGAADGDSDEIDIWVSHKPPPSFPRFPYNGLRLYPERPPYIVGRSMAETDRIGPVDETTRSRIDELWVPSTYLVDVFAGGGFDKSKFVQALFF